MVGRRLDVRDKGSVLRHLHPCTRGGVVGVDLQLEDIQGFLGITRIPLRIHRLFETVDVGDGGRDSGRRRTWRAAWGLLREG